MPKARGSRLNPIDDLRDRDNNSVLNIKRTRRERHEAHMAKLKNVRVGDVTQITEDLGDAFGNIYYITNEGDTFIVSNGIFTRVLSADLTLQNTQCLVVAGYINLNGFALTLEGEASLTILRSNK